jgi:gamma-glutamylcyclotransferase (GGCT)/AIG2-like uncharacterized protein YtfP
MTHGDGQVAGEVWDIVEEDLPRLDELEGPPYRRERVTLDDGTSAIAYLADVEDAPRIAGGRWPQGR